MKILKENIKNIIIIILLLLFIASSIIIYKLVNSNSAKSSEVTGIVIVTDSSYVIIETNTQDYLVKNIKGTYKVGDEVRFMYYTNDLNDKESPYTIKIYDEELLKVYENSEELNNNSNNSSNTVNNNQSNNTNNNQNNSSNKNDNKVNSNQDNNSNIKVENNNQNNNNTTNNETADTKVLSYFNNLKSDIDASTVKDGLKTSFITVVDFLFYEGKIKGYTFSELSNSAKLKVLEIALYFDTKIEKYFPGYKESISNTTSKIYTNVKEEIIGTYLELATIICEKDTELCNTAKEKFNNIKTNFGLTWSLIKDIANDGITNLKNWYEIWSGKTEE